MRNNVLKKVTILVGKDTKNRDEEPGIDDQLWLLNLLLCSIIIIFANSITEE